MLERIVHLHNFEERNLTCGTNYIKQELFQHGWIRYIYNVIEHKKKKPFCAFLKYDKNAFCKLTLAETLKVVYCTVST